VGDDPDLLSGLLEEFLRNAQKQTDEITAAAMTDDITTMAGVAHTLKSAARSVGALALGELCQSMETEGHNGAAPICKALVQPLVSAFAAASQAIHAHLGRESCVEQRSTSRSQSTAQSALA